MGFSLVGFFKDWVVATSQIKCWLQTHWGKRPYAIRFFGPWVVWLELQSDAEVADLLHLATISENNPFTALERWMEVMASL